MLWMSASPWRLLPNLAGTAGWPRSLPLWPPSGLPCCCCAGTTSMPAPLPPRCWRIPPSWRTPMLDSVLFYFFAGIAVISAALMITRRNAIHSAVFLITTLLATAGIFLQLRAEFLFISQIILYVGGIMVLFVFVIMLVNLDVAVRQLQFGRQRWVALLISLALAAQVGLMFWSTGKMPGQGVPVLAAAPVDKLPLNSEAVAEQLFTKYLLPFEI